MSSTQALREVPPFASALDHAAPADEPLDFTVPESLVAHEPPEARGLARDEVRLLVSSLADDSVVHTRFRGFPEYLRAGDALVVNTSATLNAASPGRRTSSHGACCENATMAPPTTPQPTAA